MTIHMIQPIEPQILERLEEFYKEKDVFLCEDEGSMNDERSNIF